MAPESIYLPELLFAALSFLAISFFPGYCVSLFLFPLKKELDFVERTVVSFAISFSMFPLALLVENQFAGIKITLFSVVFNLVIISFGGIFLFLARLKKIVLPAFFYRFFPPVKEKDGVEFGKKTAE